MNLLLVSKIAQIFLAIFVVVLVLIQAKGKGLSSSIGNSISMYRSRRGIEQGVFILTIVFSLLLVLNSVAILLLN